MKKSVFLGIMMISLLFCGKALALDPMVFDSTDNYLGGCKLTDKSEWTLPEEFYITTFQIWYNWDANETTLPVTVYKDGEEFASFTATRTTCDTYQKNWCNADYELNKVMPAGKYSTKVPSAKQCLKPGGTGTVRLYGTKDVSANADSKDITRTSPPQEEKTATRSGFSRTWYYYAGGGLILALAIYFISKRK